MKKFKKILAMVLSSAMLVVSGAVALAVTTNVDGGTWDHGVDRRTPFHWVVWSNYHHPSKRHRTWVTNGRGDQKYSGWANPNQWAKVSMGATLGTCEAHYTFG